MNKVVNKINNLYMFKAMKIKYCLLILIVFSQALHAQWISNYFGNSPAQVVLTNAHGTSVSVDNYGYCYVTGYIDEMNGSGNNVLVIKYDAETGDTAWVRTFNGTDNSDDKGNGVAVDIYQNVYIVGTAKNINKGLDVILLKFNSLGTLLWSKSFSGDAGIENDEGLDIAVDDFGYIYITGYVTGSDLRTDIFAAKYNSWGYRIWYKRDDGTDDLNAQGLKIAVNHDGSNIYVTGYIYYNEGQSDICLINFSSSDGYRIYVSHYNGAGNSEDRAFGIVVDETDNIILTGYTTVDSAGTTDCITLKYNPDGVLLWDRTYGGAANENDRAFGIAVDEDRIFVTGTAVMMSGNNDYITICYNHFGDTIWTALFNGEGLGNDEAGAVAIVYNTNNEKEVIVTGSSWGINNDYDYATVKYSYNSGTQESVSTYSLNSASEDIPTDIAVDALNNTYITGFSQLLGGNGPTGSCAATTIMTKYSQRNKKVLSSNIPREFNLMQNFPNPFNPSTIIRFTVTGNTNTTLKVYDITGKLITILMDQNLAAGSYEVTFSSLNLSSGVYFYELKSGLNRDVKKMTVIK
jgi:hypothetical protein